MPQLVWTSEPDGQIDFCNSRWLSFTGMTVEEIRGNGWATALHPDDQATTFATWQQAVNTGQEYQVLQRLRSAAGEYRWFLTRALPLKDDAGLIIKWYGTCTDIQDRKQVEEALQASEAQLRTLNQTLEQRVAERTAELQRSIQELDQFAYVASHDLKAPLRAVSYLATWIAEDAAELLPDGSKRHLDKLQSRIQRMEKLLDDLLTYSRVGRQYTKSIESVDTGGLVAEIIDWLTPPSGFTVTFQPEMPTLKAPRVLLELVFKNLIENAIKHHHRADGRIEIKAHQNNGLVEFEVSDDGPGIDPQFHDRIFQMFQTLQPRDKVEGTGVGLAIVKKAIESQGGTISVASEVGRGTTFRFTWPKS
jgi:PAS domain S-box-containing protein